MRTSLVKDAKSMHIIHDMLRMREASLAIKHHNAEENLFTLCAAGPA